MTTPLGGSEPLSILARSCLRAASQLSANQICHWIQFLLLQFAGSFTLVQHRHGLVRTISGTSFPASGANALSCSVNFAGANITPAKRRQRLQIYRRHSRQGRKDAAADTKCSVDLQQNTTSLQCTRISTKSQKIMG